MECNGCLVDHDDIVQVDESILQNKHNKWLSTNYMLIQHSVLY